MSSRFYKRFPAERRKACMPVTSTRPSQATRSQQARAVAQQNGRGASPGRSAPAPLDLNIKRTKE
jgi:hypothetical protein